MCYRFALGTMDRHGRRGVFPGPGALIVAAAGTLAAATMPAAALGQTLPTAPNGSSAPSVVVPLAATETTPVGVIDRKLARDEQLGLSYGGLLILPAVSIGVAPTTNVFATPHGRSDVIGTAKASIDAKLDTGSSQLHAGAQVDRLQYARFDSQSATEWQVTGDGKIDPADNLEIAVKSVIGRHVEPRTSSAAPTLTYSPSLYVENDNQGDVAWRGARITIGAGATYSRYSYGAITGPGISFSQRSRDYHYTEVRGRIGYDLGERQIFIAANRHWGNYDLRDPATGLNRDTDGWQVTAGLSSAITPVIKGSIGVGYLHEQFKVPSVKPISTIAFQAALDWYVTMITTAHIEASRRLENSSAFDSQGYLSTRGSIRVDHEFARELLLNLGIDYEHAAFRTIDRADNNLDLTFGGDYQFDRRLSFLLQGRYSLRTSNGPERSFDFNQSSLSLLAKYAL